MSKPQTDPVPADRRDDPLSGTTPVRGARPGEAGYRRDDYWMQVDRGLDPEAAAHDDNPRDHEPAAKRAVQEPGRAPRAAAIGDSPSDTDTERVLAGADHPKRRLAQTDPREPTADQTPGPLPGESDADGPLP